MVVQLKSFRAALDDMSEEDVNELKKLYQEVTDLINPDGAIDQKIVDGIVGLLWCERKQLKSPERAEKKKAHPALKHGAYAATAVLSDEDPKELEKLHRDLIAEFAPHGASEDHIIASLARLIFRKENLETNRIMSFCSRQLQSPGVPGRPRTTKPPGGAEGELATVMEKAAGILQDQSMEGLQRDLAVEDRLDGSIDRCLKRLLFVRGLKSIS